MSEETEPRIPFILPGVDAEALADWFDSGFPLEFCASESFDPDFIDSLCYAGFIPMAMLDQDSGLDFLLPKLHAVRSILDPKAVKIGAATRRGSRRYLLAADERFDEVLELCAATHGEEWLRPPLRAAFRELFATREGRSSRFSSFELYQRDGEGDGALVAGEIGFYAGASYTSLTGFRTLSGSGSVQLAASARFLEAVRSPLWDLGMPLDYKLSLGASLVSRSEFLRAFRAARSSTLRPTNSVIPAPARELIDRIRDPCAAGAAAAAAVCKTAAAAASKTAAAAAAAAAATSAAAAASITVAADSIAKPRGRRL